MGVISLILYSSLLDFSHHWSITTWNPIGFIHPNPRWWVLEWSYNKIAVCQSPLLSPCFFPWIFTWKLIPDAASSPCVSKSFSSLNKKLVLPKMDISFWAICNDQTPAGWSPQMVVKSKGMPPEMAERFKLRIYVIIHSPDIILCHHVCFNKS